MPDWKNEDDYAFTNDLNDEEWAWEFLRRNEEYREDFRQFQETIKQLKDEYGKDPKEWPKDSRAFFYDPPRNKEESEKKWKNRIIDEYDTDPKQYRLEKGYVKKWKLKSKNFIDPDGDSRPDFYTKVSKVPASPKGPNKSENYDIKLSLAAKEISDSNILTWKNYEEYVLFEIFFESFGVDNEHIDPNSLIEVRNKVAIGFDISLSLEEQLNDASRLLDRFAFFLRHHKLIYSTRPHSKKNGWSLYLRVLDAMIAGEEKPKIAKELFGTKSPSHQSKLKDQIRCACKTAHDYWKIPLHRKK
jgi:hypothetical protein